MSRKAKAFEFTCRHCGRVYWTFGKRTGFVKAGFFNHEAGCKNATPAERRETAKRDEERWRKNPPRSLIIIDWKHAGMRV